MKKCLLVSRFTAINIGDLVISAMLYEKVNEYFLVRRFDYFSLSYMVRDINNLITKKQKIKKQVWSSFTSLGLEKLLKGYKQTKNITVNKDDKFKVYKEELGKYDLVIIGGGNMIMSLTKENNSSIIKLERFVSLAKDQNKVVYMMDIGIGPFVSKEHTEEAIAILNRCDYITFRDESSYNLYINNGGIKEKAKVSIDSAFYFKKLSSKPKVAVHNYIGVNIINSINYGANKKEYEVLIGDYAKLINKIVEELGYHVITFTTSLNDKKALNDVHKLIKDKRKVKKVDSNGLKDLIHIYKNIDILIGARMHSMIIAYTQEVPIIGLSWQKKIDSLFEIIDEEEYLFQMKDFGRDIDKIITSCKVKLRNLESDKKDIKNKLIEIRSKKEVDKEVLESLAKENFN